MSIGKAERTITGVLLSIVLTTGCTVDATDDDTFLADGDGEETVDVEFIEVADARTDGRTAPEDTLELSGPLVDIEGLVLDEVEKCVETDVISLGQGRLEPPIFAPRCLVHDDTAVRYLVRPGSRAVPEGYTPCDLGDAFGWRMCDQARCTDSYPGQILLEYGCSGPQGVEPQCAEFDSQDIVRWYWHPSTHVQIVATTVTLDAPWVEGAPDFPTFLDGYERTRERCADE